MLLHENTLADAYEVYEDDAGLLHVFVFAVGELVDFYNGYIGRRRFGFYNGYGKNMGEVDPMRPGGVDDWDAWVHIGSLFAGSWNPLIMGADVTEYGMSDYEYCKSSATLTFRFENGGDDAGVIVQNAVGHPSSLCLAMSLGCRSLINLMSSEIWTCPDGTMRLFAVVDTDRGPAAIVGERYEAWEVPELVQDWVVFLTNDLTDMLLDRSRFIMSQDLEERSYARRRAAATLHKLSYLSSSAYETAAEYVSVRSQGRLVAAYRRAGAGNRLGTIEVAEVPAAFREEAPRLDQTRRVAAE